MCDIVGIDPALVRANQNNSGGAQIIFPTGLTYQFFEKIEDDGNKLYRFTSSDEGRILKKPEDPYPIQSWTSEMWAMLWNLWVSNIKTIVHKDMEFSWSNWGAKDWNRVKIYHNAGVTNATSGNFYKGLYINQSPFLADLSYVTKKDTCNYKYLEIILECRVKFLNDNSL